MNPLKSIPGTIIAGVVLAIVLNFIVGAMLSNGTSSESSIMEETTEETN